MVQKHAASAAVYLGSLALTLVAAFIWQSAFLTLVFLVTQFCASVYYFLSYIPGGQATVRSFCGFCCQKCPCKNLF